MIRVGISLGDADVDEGGYFGVPVVEAARLCAKAEVRLVNRHCRTPSLRWIHAKLC